MGGEREEILKKLSSELADEIPDGPIKETILALPFLDSNTTPEVLANSHA